MHIVITVYARDTLRPRKQESPTRTILLLVWRLRTPPPPFFQLFPLTKKKKKERPESQKQQRYEHINV